MKKIKIIAILKVTVHVFKQQLTTMFSENKNKICSSNLYFMLLTCLMTCSMIVNTLCYERLKKTTLKNDRFDITRKCDILKKNFTSSVLLLLMKHFTFSIHSLFRYVIFKFISIYLIWFGYHLRNFVMVALVLLFLSQCSEILQWYEKYFIQIKFNGTCCLLVFEFG